MPLPEGSKKADRKPPLILVFMPMLIGLIGLWSAMAGPRFESLRTVDVVRLLACGAGIGASLVGVLAFLLRPRA